MTTLLNNLSLLGIGEKEQKIYEILFEGPKSAAELSKISKIKRSTVYIYLENLKGVGLTLESSNGSKKYFSATNPKSLQQLIRSKIGQFKELDKSIGKIKISTKKPVREKSTDYKVYRGESGLFSIINEVVNSNEEFYFLGNNAGLDKYVTQEFWEKIYIRPRRKRMAVEYMITTSRAPRTVARYFEESGTFTKIRFLPEELDFKGAVAAFGDKLIIGKYTPEPIGVAFEDKKLVELFKTAFFALWKDLENKNVPLR
ncbi:hypothetical protein HYZ78_00400 [Candidatus Microgenomates bacterium]|nr:hypothetical protein [Candidatus Microgenomates bacterium]